jgi:hypothetical protein
MSTATMKGVKGITHTWLRALWLSPFRPMSGHNIRLGIIVLVVIGLDLFQVNQYIVQGYYTRGGTGMDVR